MRQIILDRDNGLCQNCQRDGRTKEGNIIHHIKPWLSGVNDAEKDKLMWDKTNLEVVCSECHIEIHKELGVSNYEADELARFAIEFIGLDRHK